MKRRTVKLLECLIWGLMSGGGILAWLWQQCPAWDCPTARQVRIMFVTLLPLCIISFVYIVLVAPVCLALALTVDLLNSQDVHFDPFHGGQACTRYPANPCLNCQYSHPEMYDRDDQLFCAVHPIRYPIKLNQEKPTRDRCRDFKPRSEMGS